ncbi:MAG: cobalamin-dependent protein [Casimicrobiaceae bacterium]
MDIDTPCLAVAGLQRFEELRHQAIDTVTERLCAAHAAVYVQFGQRGREACREDLGFHLEFMRPVLEFGIIQPMVDYLRWLAVVLATRDIPAQHLALSLDLLAEFFAMHMEAADAEIVGGALRRTKARYLAADDASPAIYEMMPAAWPECEAFESALLAGDRNGALSLLDRRFEQGHGLVETELHMIQPALYEIGRKWQQNQVSVAQEHLATAISQSVMTHGLLQSKVPSANGRRVLLACVAGNNHALGLQMVSDAFHLAGWDVQYLGADVPTNALIRHIAQDGPHLLGLSVSFAHQLRVVKAITARLTQALGAARPPVIVGGLAINQFSRLAGLLGADGWSPDASAAVTFASKLDVPLHSQ